MKNLIILFTMLLMCVLSSSCETQEINDEAGIEDIQEQPKYTIDKDQVEPGSKG